MVYGPANPTARRFQGCTRSLEVIKFFLNFAEGAFYKATKTNGSTNDTVDLALPRPSFLPNRLRDLAIPILVFDVRGREEVCRLAL